MPHLISAPSPRGTNRWPGQAEHQRDQPVEQCKVTVLDEQLRELPGYTAKDCTGPEQSGLSQRVVWGQQQNVWPGADPHPRGFHRSTARRSATLRHLRSAGIIRSVRIERTHAKLHTISPTEFDSHSPARFAPARPRGAGGRAHLGPERSCANFPRLRGMTVPHGADATVFHDAAANGANAVRLILSPSTTSASIRRRLAEDGGESSLPARGREERAHHRHRFPLYAARRSELRAKREGRGAQGRATRSGPIPICSHDDCPKRSRRRAS